MTNEKDTNTKLEIFTTMTFTMLDAVAPTKQVKIACDDPAWMNTRIKTYIRRRNREFEKNSKSRKYKALAKKCTKLCKTAKREFATSFVTDLKDKDPRTWMASMKKLSRSNHEKDNDTWHFVDEVKSNQLLTDEILQYVAKISENFSPIDRSLLPFIPSPDAPFVSEVDCFPAEH